MTREKIINHILATVTGQSGMAEITLAELEELGLDRQGMEELMSELTWDIGCYVQDNRPYGYSFLRDPEPDASARFVAAHEAWMETKQ